MSEDWMHVTVIVPPDASKAFLSMLESRYGFQVTDWCEWRAPNGAYMSISPSPSPDDIAAETIRRARQVLTEKQQEPICEECGESLTGSYGPDWCKTHAAYEGET